MHTHMATTHSFKNYLRTSRLKLGLTQHQVAEIIGKTPPWISAMESGRALPTTGDCVAFQVLFKKSFNELWQRHNFEIEATTDSNIRRLITQLQKGPFPSERNRKKAKLL